ncbi:MAG: BlaI/MecI/CopY family transcriptional regulator [Lachnospiraceae bacterium]|nr:BlaI/MecI/CopY family transcriptional regulator [Lachnospiraceae bacterium]
MTKKPSESLENFGGRKQLSETELEYMKVIWAHPNGITSDDIYKQFSNAKGTKSTILFRISEKGYVNLVRKGKHFVYTPQVTELEYKQALMRTKLKKTFGIGQLPDFIAAFCGKKQLSAEQLQRTKQFLKELEDE